MSILGCSSHLVKTKEVAILPENALLLSPCSAKSDFQTPREQGVVFIENYYCIQSYETKLESLRKWKEEKQRLYNGK